MNCDGDDDEDGDSVLDIPMPICMFMPPIAMSTPFPKAPMKSYGAEEGIERGSRTLRSSSRKLKKLLGVVEGSWMSGKEEGNEDWGGVRREWKGDCGEEAREPEEVEAVAGEFELLAEFEKSSVWKMSFISVEKSE